MNPTTTQYIEIRKNRSGEDRPFIVGTRVRVQDIVADSERQGLTAEEIALQYPHISIAQVHAALSYFHDNKEAVWACLNSDAAFADSMRSEFGQRQQQGGNGTDANSDSVPS